MDFWGNLDDFARIIKRAGEDVYNYLDTLIPDDWKSKPGDPGYWDPSSPDTDLVPYLPGADTLQQMSDTQRYWTDYRKNTGFKPRYPGVAIHTPNAAQTINSFDWWMP